MRNPLKKLQKKINFRLANNAAQHSQIPSTKTQQQNRHHDSLTSHASLVDEDPLFNNRSSKLRLALSESKKANNGSTTNNNNNSQETPKKKKKGRGRLSFGGTGGSKRSQAVASVPAPANTEQVGKKSMSLPTTTTTTSALSYAQSAPQTPPRSDGTSPQSPSRTRFDAPTMSSQQKMRDKVETTSTSTITSQPVHATAKVTPQPAPTSTTTNKPSTTQQPPTNNNNNNNKTPAKKAAPKILDPNLERIAKAAAALDNTGNALFEKGEYDKAMANYVKALKLKNRTLAGTQPIEANAPLPQLPPEKPAAVVAAAENQSGNDANNNDTATTNNNLDSTTDEQAAKGGGGGQADDLWISVATSINNIGYLRQQSGQASAEETMQAYQNSLQIKRRVLGNDNLSVGKTLNNLGTVHYLKREYAQALEAYQEALQIMMATLGPHHLDVGTVHSNIGDVYWAQSGDVVKANNDHAQQNYQDSRNAALQHYRQSLEIRWEELKDHHDPKVIRLLEKIAALEMGESFLALVQNNHKHRLSPKGNNNAGAANNGSPSRSVADEALEAEAGDPLVEEELQNLQQEVQSDVKQMDMMERKMAIDMVKDKLRLVREMKKLSNITLYSSDDDLDDLSLGTEAQSPSNVKPLSPVERQEALCAVKERLRQLRDSRKKEEQEPWRSRFSSSEVSDLKEADRSPSNFFLSQRAAQLMHRTLQPPPSIDALDELKKFSFNETENDPMDISSRSDALDISSRGYASRKASHQLEEGIDALRSLPVNQDNVPNDGNPWLLASTLTTSPKKQFFAPSSTKELVPAAPSEAAIPSMFRPPPPPPKEEALATKKDVSNHPAEDPAIPAIFRPPPEADYQQANSGSRTIFVSSNHSLPSPKASHTKRVSTPSSAERLSTTRKHTSNVPPPSNRNLGSPKAISTKQVSTPTSAERRSLSSPKAMSTKRVSTPTSAERLSTTRRQTFATPTSKLSSPKASFTKRISTPMSADRVSASRRDFSNVPNCPAPPSEDPSIPALFRPPPEADYKRANSGSRTIFVSSNHTSTSC